jgi:hypothetical protein
MQPEKRNHMHWAYCGRKLITIKTMVQKLFSICLKVLAIVVVLENLFPSTLGNVTIDNTAGLR